MENLISTNIPIKYSRRTLMSMYMTKNKKELVVTCDCKCGQSFGVSVDDDQG